jgi:hypothetical protein
VRDPQGWALAALTAVVHDQDLDDLIEQGVLEGNLDNDDAVVIMGALLGASLSLLEHLAEVAGSSAAEQLEQLMPRLRAAVDHAAEQHAGG